MLFISSSFFSVYLNVQTILSGSKISWEWHLKLAESEIKSLSMCRPTHLPNHIVRDVKCTHAYILFVWRICLFFSICLLIFDFLFIWHSNKLFAFIVKIMFWLRSKVQSQQSEITIRKKNINTTKSSEWVSKWDGENAYTKQVVALGVFPFNSQKNHKWK